MKHSVLLLLTCLCFVACQSTRLSTDAAKSEEETPLDGLLFITLELEKDEEGIQANILSAKKAPGKLKRPNREPETGEVLVIDFLSADDRVLHSQRVENPLRRNVEVSNEAGSFERHQLNLDKASIVLRIQYFHSMRKLRVSDSSGKVLSLIDLDL